MIKLMFGSVAAAVAMFVAAFLYFGGPLSSLGFHSAGENQNAVLQEALKANLPTTGTYQVPEPTTQTGTILYGNGPVATVHFNTGGFPVDSADGMLWGFVLFLVAAVLMAGALSQLDRRVPDFRSRAFIVLGFVFAISAVNLLTDPIFMHQDWRYAIFTFVGDVIVLGIGGLILARWFLPTRAELAMPASASPSAASPAVADASAATPVPGKVEEAGSTEEIPTADGPRV
jgi:hypothetical protein